MSTPASICSVQLGGVMTAESPMAARSRSGTIAATLASMSAAQASSSSAWTSTDCERRAAISPLLPGPARSEILGDYMAKQAKENGVTLGKAEQGFLQALRPTTLIQRFATTDEVANMIVYACSEQAAATSGAALRVNGGVVRFVAWQGRSGDEYLFRGSRQLPDLKTPNSSRSKHLGLHAGADGL